MCRHSALQSRQSSTGPDRKAALQGCHAPVQSLAYSNSDNNPLSRSVSSGFAPSTPRAGGATPRSGGGLGGSLSRSVPHGFGASPPSLSGVPSRAARTSGVVASLSHKFGSPAPCVASSPSFAPPAAGVRPLSASRANGTSVQAQPLVQTTIASVRAPQSAVGSQQMQGADFTVVPAKPSAIDNSMRLAIQAIVIFDAIDNSHQGSISKLDLLKAVQVIPEVRKFVFPNEDCARPMQNEQSFDAVHSLFRRIGSGKKRISEQEFVSFFDKKVQVGVVCNDQALLHGDRVRHAFQRFGSDGDGMVSKLELMCAVQRDPVVASIMFPDTDHNSIISDSGTFEVIDEVFDQISTGKKRIGCHDFLEHFSKRSGVTAPKAPLLLRARHDLRRNLQRVLIIGPGFGAKLNPRQYQMLEQAGFIIEWVHVPNPEVPGFCIARHLGTVKAAIDEFQPDLLASASKGGLYTIALWDSGLWRGPTLMLNVHPSLKELPKSVPIVIAHGENDELYTRPRADLEQLISTGSPNMCFLYTTVDSGKVSGASVRQSDTHNMASLLTFDCLPRLVDAALSPAPEMQMMCSWRCMLATERLLAEEALGYSPEELRRWWTSKHQHGVDKQKLHQVPCSHEEFRKIAAVFLSTPNQQSVYRGASASAWRKTDIVKIERIENGPQMEGSSKPYYESLQKSIEEQGLEFEPGAHTHWAFHGTNDIESVVTSPMAGFQPLEESSCLGSAFGAGTYFARDAKLVVDANLCSTGADGTHKMIMCLLMAGMTCAGSPDQRGILPMRQKPHRYNSSVDSLSNPELFIMQHPSSAHPAYVITFRP